MTGLVKGISRKSGEFEGNAYDNIYLHCIMPADESTICGKLVEAFKMKAFAFNAACDRQKVASNDLLGCQVRIIYGKYNKVDDFDILSRPEKKT